MWYRAGRRRRLRPSRCLYDCASSKLFVWDISDYFRYCNAQSCWCSPWCSIWSRFEMAHRRCHFLTMSTNIPPTLVSKADARSTSVKNSYLIDWAGLLQVIVETTSSFKPFPLSSLLLNVNDTVHVIEEFPRSRKTRLQKHFLHQPF